MEVGHKLERDFSLTFLGDDIVHFLALQSLPALVPFISFFLNWSLH